MNTTDLQLAWCAGFVDGEGCISLGKQGSIQITVGQQVEPPLLILRGLFGGSVQQRATAGALSAAPFFIWRVARRKAERALRALLPYLVVKRAAAEIAIASRALVGQSGLAVDQERRALLDGLRRELSALGTSKRSRAVVASIPEATDVRARLASYVARRPGTYALNGRAMNMSDWARELGVSPTAIQSRIDKWGVERALSTPVSARHKKVGQSAARKRWQSGAV